MICKIFITKLSQFFFFIIFGKEKSNFDAIGKVKKMRFFALFLIQKQFFLKTKSKIFYQ